MMLALRTRCCLFYVRKAVGLTAVLLGFCFIFLFRAIFQWNEHNFETLNQPFYRRNHSINCGSIFKLEKEAISMAKKLDVSLQKEYDIWKIYGDCESVKRRHFYPNAPLTVAEEGFPIAYTILVYDHLEQIELLLNSIYMPQNLYCFHIDFKASFLIRDALQRLAKCFTNVIFSERNFPIQRRGINMVKAFYSCLKQLHSIAIHSNWKYVLTIQDHDFPIRTNAELVEILKLHNGANDVELLPPPVYRYATKWEHVIDAQGFPVDQKQTNQKKSPPPGHLSIFKGSTATALSREFVDFILKNSKVQQFVPWLDDVMMGDELFWSTLNHDEEFGAPGGYPGRCVPDVDKNQAKTWISRFAIWKTYTHLKCAGQWRHTVCLFSIADLPMLAQRPELFVNKFWLPYDAGALYCMHERMFNRTYMPEVYREHFNRTFYENLPAVKFNKWKLENPGRSSRDFPCQFCYNCSH